MKTTNKLFTCLIVIFYAATFFAVGKPLDTIRGNNHSYVNLGLSVCWATTNIGAIAPEYAGKYYNWGDIYSEDEDATYIKYFNLFFKTHKTEDLNHLLVLNASEDAAQKLWGDSWRLPTAFECQELIDKCSWEWDALRHGFIITGPNGNHIFLPAGGEIDLYGKLEGHGTRGCYWCSTYCYNTRFQGVGPDYLWFKNGKDCPSKCCCVSGVDQRPHMLIRPVWSSMTSEESLKNSILKKNAKQSHK